MQGKSKISSFLFLMLVKGKNERVGFKIFLRSRRDGKTLKTIFRKLLKI